MNKHIITFAAAGAMALMSTLAHAGSWSLSADESKVSFGSIKKDKVGEVHHFTGLEGSVAEDGKATVAIDVTSIETWIDIRNERMLKHVFDSENFPKVSIAATIDMKEVSGLKPGESTTVTTDTVIGLAGNEVEIEAGLFVLAVSDDKVLVTTDEMIMLSTADLGVTAGIDKLMELAKLPSITRAAPVTLRLMFVKG